ncbi:MAG: hypothetical protein Q4P78_04795 [Rothia sp. (in: high G+C Gram-positive bacteria)]|uniref:hypothetical protein n=1 Tax=Rothia sp. (in: high G+C Gram-positive bacteria) TaxID=1885016 RepID=UPI0026E0B2CA|nr:hypothetical protein [Rothia sp. (in: high G+C Gram-positive bacteria)]MDO5750509.1 hypothetical protein [Rothia sp. (in: high G+C Gram-positive bacteria)]
MKDLRKILVSILIITALLNSNTITLDKYDSPIYTAIQRGENPQNIGKELFIAIHSGVGSEKYGLPPLLSRHPLSSEESKSWYTIVQILDEYGYNFQKFLSDITSGDPYIVESTLIEGTNLITDKDSKYIHSEPTACGPTFCIGLLVVVAVAAVVSTLAAGYNYAAGVNVVVKALVWTIGDNYTTNTLKEDNIRIITESLRYINE